MRPLVIAVAVSLLVVGGIAASRPWRAAAPTLAATSAVAIARTYPVDDVRRLPPPAFDLLPGRLVVALGDCTVAHLDPTTGATTASAVHACSLRGSTLRAADGRYVRVVLVGSHLEATLYRRNGHRLAAIARCAGGVHATRITLSADATILVVETTDGGVTVTTLAGRRLERRLGPEHILTAAISPDGRWIAASTDDGVAFLDATTLAPRAFTPVVARDVRWDAG